MSRDAGLYDLLREPARRPGARSYGSTRRIPGQGAGAFHPRLRGSSWGAMPPRHRAVRVRHERWSRQRRRAAGLPRSPRRGGPERSGGRRGRRLELFAEGLHPQPPGDQRRRRRRRAMATPPCSTASTSRPGRPTTPGCPAHRRNPAELRGRGRQRRGRPHRPAPWRCWQVLRPPERRRADTSRCSRPVRRGRAVRSLRPPRGRVVRHPRGRPFLIGIRGAGSPTSATSSSPSRFTTTPTCFSARPRAAV